MMFALILMVIFIASDLAHSPTLSYLFWSVVLLLIGIIFWRRDFAPPPPSDRFRIFRPKPKDKKEK